jgi:enamine deaminase RidA (YjgF/YER057c/UK114 family)
LLNKKKEEKMSGITEVSTKTAPAPLPVFSQAIKANGFVFVSGNIGLDKDTWTLVEGGIKAQTVRKFPWHFTKHL